MSPRPAPRGFPYLEHRTVAEIDGPQLTTAWDKFRARHHTPTLRPLTAVACPGMGA